MTVITERLKLVPLSERFLDDIFRFFTSEIALYMIPQPTGNVKDTRDFIQAAITAREKGSDLEFAITLAETGEFIGCAGIHESNTTTPELGLWLKKTAHGHKYGCETILALIDFAAAHLTIEHFVYKADRRNIASRRIPESCGGVMVERSTMLNSAGKQLDAIEYRIPI